ncbi:1-(5-phosphoribosyl)-5-[(5-phosphoribosylamino)methylideneamino] imidazole-4-carboxamide isomerase [Corynebacterium capitovis DSM 44611]|uniref:bifunctional 1-(5-phosphoribosyl)-5-((5- phosphoribosylamino)methylideneamino)imidazole-4- carboxamide isomerase/phosphoribosylanthranilate isomerase PriA n=1 Tax=Corynebacterium capitovis TaxID=131081 RepID=UPI0003771906|nr:bifunctional 1-(5-phosphoribosyl)-5-((5-phosphoribosylamino)methylideneamino)imidazole-4-carboxamide isomerase/phosphoribosylanthranilate isomerase PriA [Corynebacterium capitovis]WKD57408.1 1-(5-phosphoribosyl)-5-[(5-phosphoribosylamino)methylideneamino] imidazole-4-carboxamide isomerase [Corynebacterium capitovis DSM 44611]
MTFTLLPAVDVVNGRAVRLDQGEAGTERDYGDPLEAARRWRDEGAQWLHFVDLDAAFGRGSNHELMAEITRTIGIDVELTGGIRDTASLERALGTGARRVNIGTAALREPEWTADMIRRHGDAIAVDIAVREEDGQWRTKGDGWTSDGGDVWEVLEFFDAAGCARFVVTDVSRDGTLTGPNVDLLRGISAATDAFVTASGGIAQLDDVSQLSQYEGEGIDSAIIGTALYEGRFTLREALRAVERSEKNL